MSPIYKRIQYQKLNGFDVPYWDIDTIPDASPSPTPSITPVITPPDCLTIEGYTDGTFALSKYNGMYVRQPNLVSVGSLYVCDDDAFIISYKHINYDDIWIMSLSTSSAFGILNEFTTAPNGCDSPYNGITPPAGFFGNASASILFTSYEGQYFLKEGVFETSNLNSDTLTITYTTCVSPTPTPTITPSNTMTPSVTQTPSTTPSITPTSSITPTPSITSTPTLTPSTSPDPCPACNEFEIINNDLSNSLTVEYTDCNTYSIEILVIGANTTDYQCSCDTPIRVFGSTDYVINFNGVCPL